MYQLLKGLKYLHDRLISHRGTPSSSMLMSRADAVLQISRYATDHLYHLLLTTRPGFGSRKTSSYTRLDHILAYRSPTSVWHDLRRTKRPSTSAAPCPISLQKAFSP